MYHKMKLNPKKCVFGVRAGKFLGFMVSKRGIDANPDKVQAIMKLPKPRGVKDIQRRKSADKALPFFTLLRGNKEGALMRIMAALTRFVSKSADKALPFFTLLRGNKEVLLHKIKSYWLGGQLQKHIPVAANVKRGF